VDHNAIDKLLSYVPEDATMEPEIADTIIRQISPLELTGLIQHSPLGKALDWTASLSNCTNCSSRYLKTLLISFFGY
jgi:hypothetical protein